MSGQLQYPQKETIEYEYPDLGLVNISLWKESAEIYRFLRDEDRDGISYFEKLDQLGALRAVHKSAHHSRWEYMVLQMHLIQEFKKHGVSGFATTVQITTKHEVSSLEELLKSWVLLNNYGHLPGTFEFERVWFEIVLSEHKLYEALLHCMPDKLSKTLAEHVIGEEDLYYFHHLIALALLGSLSKKKYKSKPPFSLWIHMLQALLSRTLDEIKPKEGSTLYRALSIFNTIRRISYVLLDINQSALFLRVDSGNLLRTLIRQPDAVLYDPQSEINEILSHIERLLFLEVYASQKACAFTFDYIQYQKQRYTRLIRRQGIDVFCKDDNSFVGKLSEAKLHEFGEYKQESKVRHIFRLNLLPNFVFERTNCHFYTEREKLRTATNIDVDFLVTPTPYTKGGSIIDVYTGRKLDTRGISTLNYALIKHLTDCYQMWVNESGSLNFVLSRPLQELFTQILAAFINHELAIRFQTGTSPRDFHVDALTSEMSRRKWNGNFTQGIKGVTALDRNWELKSLLQLLRRQKGEIFLIAISNIHLYSADGTSKVEWDGVFLSIQRENITLYILEAKRREVVSRQVV